MFKNSIPGLKGLFNGDSDISKNSVLLVTGREGSLKSGLVFSMISNHLSGNDEHALYLTLEETKESHFRNMESLGIKKLDRLHMFDYKDIRLEWEKEELSITKTIENTIDFYREKYNLTVFALDSLNALHPFLSQINLRKDMYHFFTMLRDKDLTSFLIMENCYPEKHVLVRSDDSLERPEYFLADGIIELGIIEGKENVKRYIQIRKIRGANHSMEKHQIVVEKDGIHVLGSVY